LLVALAQAREKLGVRDADERRRHERLDGDVSQLASETEQPPEDECLATDVDAAEIVARIGLGVTGSDRRPEGARERLAAPELAEEKTECARGTAFDRGDAIARVEQLLQRVDH